MFVETLSDDQYLTMAVTKSKEDIRFWTTDAVGFLEVDPRDDEEAQKDLLFLGDAYYAKIQTIFEGAYTQETTCEIVGIDGVGRKNHTLKEFRELGNKVVTVYYDHHYIMTLGFD